MKPRFRIKAGSRPQFSVVQFEPRRDENVGYVLTQMNEMQANGDLLAIAVAAVRPGGSIATAYVSGGHLFPLFGALRALDKRISRELL